MSYPHFIGPDQHRPFAYYRSINLCGYVIAPLVIVFNEVFVRPRLATYLASPDGFVAFVALLLNAHVPALIERNVHVAVFLFAAVVVLIQAGLPRWGWHASRTNLKRGLPWNSEYKGAFFCFESRSQEIAHFLWHSVLVKVAAPILFICPCVFINLFRGFR